jgi:hypothetical protein
VNKIPDMTHHIRPSSSSRCPEAFHALRALIEQGNVGIYHDHNVGLYPGRGHAPSAAYSPLGPEWAQVQKLWLGSFELFFDAVAEGEIEPDRGWYKAESGVTTMDVRKRRRIRPSQKASFRTASRWLVPRLPDLFAAGWTLHRLFGVGRGPPRFITGGVAWGSVWGKASEVTLEPDGRIRFKIYETKGPVYQTAYPPEYKHSTPVCCRA